MIFCIKPFCEVENISFGKGDQLRLLYTLSVIALAVIVGCKPAEKRAEDDWIKTFN